MLQFSRIIILIVLYSQSMLFLGMTKHTLLSALSDRAFTSTLRSHAQVRRHLSNHVSEMSKSEVGSPYDTSLDEEADDSSTSGAARKQLYQICWTNANGTVNFDAYEGETLRTAALRRGVVSPHNGRSQLINCRGLGTCGTCAVELNDGRVDPFERNTKERLRLSFPPHGGQDQSPSLRLACQIQVRSDLNVTKRHGFWGQYHQTLSTSTECVTYFGDLEYRMDNRSPKDPE